MRTKVHILYLIFLLLPLFWVGLVARAESASPAALVINHGSRDKKEIALTFDADMTRFMLKELHSGKVKSFYDARIIDILEKEKIPATLFITGLWAQTYPNELTRLASQPLFEIANHSFDHSAFKEPCYTLPPAKNAHAEISKTQDILFRLTGKMPNLFRFPGGCYLPHDIELVRNAGLKVIGWDVSSTDAFSKKKEHIITHVLSAAQNGSIIVMHLSGGPNAPETADALPDIISGLRQRGFSFATVTTLLRN